MMATAATSEAIQSPFVILVDDREGLPFAFANIKGDARDGNKPIAVRTEVRRLETGDYTIDGYADRIACERKSHGTNTAGCRRASTPTCKPARRAGMRSVGSLTIYGG